MPMIEGKNETLKPCPFCRNKNVSATWDREFDDHYVECNICFVKGPCRDDREQAIASWNRYTTKSVETDVCSNCGQPLSTHTEHPTDRLLSICPTKAHHSTAQLFTRETQVEEMRVSQLQQPLDECREQVAQMRAILAELQWSDSGFCPTCGMRPSFGHQPKCVIAQNLRGMR